MSKELSSYRQIVKATSIFGGVQVFNILIQVVRSKIVAVLLGPTGMGIYGLLNSALKLVGSMTGFGLGVSAVKNVAEANGTQNNERIAVVITVLRRWVWITGLLGAIVTIIAAPWLSQLTFGNGDYTLAFIWIAVSLLFNQLSNGQMALLQGMRKIKYLANANITGAIMGLLVSVPIFYVWGINGIVPAIIVTSVASMIRSWYFANKVKIEKVEVTPQVTISEGKDMLKMGFMLSLSGLITTGAAYALRTYISNVGSVAHVGLFNAGFSLINTYVGMVFTAMGKDYYPRLSEVANDYNKSTQLVNQQAEIAILILAPILAVFLIYINWVVILLYSQKFVPINEMIHWAALGIFFKAASWPMGFLFLAKGASKIYFKKELFIHGIMLIFNITGYYYYGLEGLGVSFLVSYIVNFLLVFWLVYRNYSFHFTTGFFKIFLVQFILGLACFSIVKFSENNISYILGSVFILLSTTYSTVQLNRRIQLRGLLKSLKSNRK